MTEQHTGLQWREWNAETFADAQAQDKPILLDIGAVWCHWCHVMDEGIAGDPVHTGTYSNPDVQRLIAEYFIPIKVDNDKRPDINARYNFGGWPTTAFLSPQGETLYGETYVPPDRMVKLLQHIATYYATEKDDLAAKSAEMAERRAEVEAENSAAERLDSNTALHMLASIKKSFDFAYGGFGNAPKFPHPATVALCLEQYRISQDSELKTIAEKTMQGMSSGGMYDRFAGGFFRYSTTRDWSIPHFEKMLEDNARLTAVYATASSILDDPQYLETVQTAHAWLLTDMYDSATGTFAGSQDADAEEAYYGEPLSVRATLPTPYIDRTVYANWNAMMVSALAARYKVERDENLLTVAQKTFAFLQDQMSDALSQKPALALHHYWFDGHAQGTVGLLNDQTEFIAAGVDLYEITGDAQYLTAAKHAAEYLLTTLQDENSGGFYDLQPNPDAIGELARPKKDLNDNATAALALLRLAAFTEEAQYCQSAESALKLFVQDYKSQGYFAAQYARAVEVALRPSLHIVIVGDRQDERLQALQNAAWTTFAIGKAVETLDIQTGESEKRGYPANADGSPRAYVCIGTQCLAPISDANQLRQQIEQAAKSPQQ